MILTHKQREALDILEDSTTTEFIFGGGAGGAKSLLGCYWLLKNSLKYPGTRWLMGRSKLKTLKETTLNTFLEVCQMQGVKPDIHFKINHQSNIITLYNGTEILMKDLFFYPSDKNFDELGSLEISGAFIDECNQLVSLAWSVVKSRIRYKLEEYNLKGVIFGTCNPSKGFVYADFYKPEKNGSILPGRRFIASLAKDNPYLPKKYIDNLNSLPKNLRDRLYLGLWETDDDPTSLIDYENIENLFSNIFNINLLAPTYITVDPARYGKDKAVIIVWRGLEVIEIFTYAKSSITTLNTAIIALRVKHNVSLTRVIVDDDGVGGGLTDMLKCIGFVNNSKALNNENYQNLKTQCYYKLAEMTQSNSLYISAAISAAQKEEIIEEFEQIKASDLDKDGKLKIQNKETTKSMLNRSPDYSDAIMLRMYFEVGIIRTRLTIR